MCIRDSAFPWLGLSYRDDALERRNPASLAAWSGGCAGLAAIYAGGNLGEGPSYAENVFSVGLAATGWFLLWMLLEIAGSVSVLIAEERDLASGLRLGGYLLGSGLVLARAVAGNWHSVNATLEDFGRDGCFAAALCALAVLVDRFARPCRARPFPRWKIHGLLPAIAYLASSIAWVRSLGPWEGMRP